MTLQSKNAVGCPAADACSTTPQPSRSTTGAPSGAAPTLASRAPVRSRAMRHVGSVAIVAALMFVALPASAESLQFTGTAHDLKNDRVLFVERYDVQVENGRWATGTTQYVSPSGQPIAERKFDFSTDRYVPVYTLDQTNPEYHEGITRIDKGKVDLFMIRDGKRQSASLDRVKEMVADCGAQGYVVDHLDELQSGATLHFTLAVAGRTDSFALRASKVGDATVGGRSGMRVRIELDSLLRLMLPPLELTIDPRSKQLLEYSGISNLKDPATKRAYSARIVYSYK